MKILVRAPNWVGDAVMAIPALEAIRRIHAAAEIAILGPPAVADLYRDQPFANTIVEYDKCGRHNGWRGREILIRDLRRERFDLAVILQNAFEAAWLAWRAGIPERARRAGWSDSRGEIAPIRLCVPLPARESAKAALLRAGAREGAWRCAIAPGASYGAAKCWPPERFASLADRLISECGADVILFGTPNEKEMAARICSAMQNRPISLVGQTSMRDLAALFSSCSIFIGNDSGAMHVAAAAGLPVIGIFGSTDPGGTAPVTSQFTLIREVVSCSPCFLRSCPVDHRCMTRIGVDSVFAAAQRVQLARRNSQNWSSQNA